MTTLAVIACHFKSENELCGTTIMRLQKALQTAWELSPEKVTFMVGGNVPYKKGGPTLQRLMKEWLVECGVEKSRIIFNEGTGMFSEAQESARMLAALSAKKVFLVSSDWWLWSGKTVWRKVAKLYNLPVEFIAVRHTGGLRARLTYLVYAVVVHASFVLGLCGLVAALLNKTQEKRLEGFTWDGCA